MKTIVWIHGFPLSSAMFEKQRALFADGKGVQHLMPDLPGFGGTPAPGRGEITIDHYARHVLSELDTRGIARATFAGFSMGGYIALAIARIAPHRLDGLILIDTREKADTPEARQGRYDTIEKVRKDGIGSVIDSMLPKMLTANATQDLRNRVNEIMSASSPEGVMAALKVMAGRPDSTPVLPSIEVPTLIVVGTEDTITPPADAERMAAAIPDAKLVKIAGAAHMSNFEKADEFNEAVRGFVDS